MSHKDKPGKRKVIIRKHKVYGFRYTLKEKDKGWVTIVIGTAKSLDECFDKIRKYLHDM